MCSPCSPKPPVRPDPAHRGRHGHGGNGAVAGVDPDAIARGVANATRVSFVLNDELPGGIREIGVTVRR
jgi:hypothetical protein